MRRKVFVVGCQRSGTTLTGQVIGAHPCAVLVDERDRVARWMDADFEARAAPVRALYRWRSLRSARRNYKDPGERFTRFAWPRKHVSHLVFKTPNLTYSASEIARTDSGSPIVYLVRDIRDVVVSIRESLSPILENQLRRIRALPELAPRFPRETEFLFDERAPCCMRIAAVVAIKMSLAQDFLESGFPTMVLRYEDLVTDPARWIPRLIEHVGLEGSESAIAHHLSLTGMGPGGTLRTRAIDQESIGRWRRVLSPVEVSQIHEVAGELNETLGYRHDGVLADPVA